MCLSVGDGGAKGEMRRRTFATLANCKLELVCRKSEASSSGVKSENITGNSLITQSSHLLFANQSNLCTPGEAAAATSNTQQCETLTHCGLYHKDHKDHIFSLVSVTGEKQVIAAGN